jgi:hypothetical protein
MQTKITQGEWHVDGHNTIAVIAKTTRQGITGNIDTYQHVCTCNYGYAKPEENIELNKANAKLISAAPDLLEALTSLYTKFKGEGLGSDKWYGPIMESAKAAIKKATE